MMQKIQRRILVENVAEKYWYWYQSWVDFVKNHCENNKNKYVE
jgi:hypothetical protein